MLNASRILNASVKGNKLYLLVLYAEAGTVFEKSGNTDMYYGFKSAEEAKEVGPEVVKSMLNSGEEISQVMIVDPEGTIVYELEPQMWGADKPLWTVAAD